MSDDSAFPQSDKIKPEDLLLRQGIKFSPEETKTIGNVYNDYFLWRSYRSGMYMMFRGYSFEDYLILSRELFWNSLNTQSTDLQKLGLEFSIPFARKESMDFLSRLTSLNMKPHFSGDSLDALGTKLLQGIYKKWYFKSNEKVETFWDLLYGVVNGTVANYIGYRNEELNRRYLESYDPTTGAYSIKERKEKYWDDVHKTLVPIEDIYIPKIYERNIQNQGKLIWKTQMDEWDFHAQYDKYPLSKFVFPGSRVAEDSVFFRLLGGTGTTTARKIEVLHEYDWIKDEYKITAGGLLLNRLGTSDGSKFDVMPNPFDHKMAPFTWGVMGPLDAKLAYGLSTPFQSKDPHKILNTFYSMGVERELRAIDPVLLSSDIDTPQIIFGRHGVLNVGDINAYKELQISEPSNGYYTMMSTMENQMTAVNQGGDAGSAASRQPKSAREEMNNEQQQQQALSNATIMYYDILRQQVLLVLKTALQFYTVEKVENGDKEAIRTLLITDMPLTQGGIGNIKINIVKEHKQTYGELFLKGIKESILNGKPTEVLNVPIEFIENLEYYVSKIDLESDNPTELELQQFVENVITPMIQTYVPAGTADISKVMARHMEKMGEVISDYVPDSMTAAMMSGKSVQPKQPQAPVPGQGSGAPTPGGQANTGAAAGNLLQSLNGTKNGADQSGPLGPKFGSRQTKPLSIKR